MAVSFPSLAMPGSEDKGRKKQILLTQTTGREIFIREFGVYGVFGMDKGQANSYGPKWTRGGAIR
jgi:hypothetical protein